MKKYLLIGILVVAFFLRLWNVWGADILGDEAAYAFRSIGYVDYLGTSFQTQPIDWYKDQSLPRWTTLSFHDHPPLFFIVQNIFFRIFGDSILVARLPAILLGVFSVFLVYLLAKKLFKNEEISFFVALLFAIGNPMVWIFRTSLIEPLLLFLLLANLYYFFRFLEDRKWWWVFGVTLGLIALTKYTGGFLIPVYVFYLVFYQRKIFRDWRFYAALAVAALLFSPVIAYNGFLYKERGHFDLQFSYLLGQTTPEWTGLVGKLQSPFSEIGKNLATVFGIPGLAVFGLGLLYSLFLFLKNRFRKEIVFLWLYLIFTTLLLVKIGSAPRFLTLYGPAAAIFSGLLVSWLWSAGDRRTWRFLFRLAIIGFLAFELSLAFYKNILISYDYGIAKLDNYFIEEFRGKESGVIPQADQIHLDAVVQRFSLKKSDQPRDFWAIIYNDNLALPTLEWIFYRRFFYHSIPTMYIENFVKTLDNDPLYFSRPVKFTLYFVQSTEHTPLNEFKADKTVGSEFEESLIRSNLQPDKIIFGHDNLPMFRIYKFSL